VELRKRLLYPKHLSVGRRSATPTPLTYPRSCNDLIVIASNAGLSFHPRWFLNAIARPVVSVRIGRES